MLDGLVEDFSSRLVQSHPHAELHVTEAWRKHVLDKLGDSAGIEAAILCCQMLSISLNSFKKARSVCGAPFGSTVVFLNPF